MRFVRVAAGLTAAAAAVLGLSLTTAGPASAAIYQGTWRAYGNTNPITSSSSTWKCTPSKMVEADILAQACAIRSSSGTAVQGAVLVRNNRSSLYHAHADTRVDAPPGTYPTSYLGTWHCSVSGLGANSWSVCFGQTITRSGPVYSTGELTGYYRSRLGTTPYV